VTIARCEKGGGGRYREEGGGDPTLLAGGKLSRRGKTISLKGRKYRGVRESARLVSEGCCRGKRRMECSRVAKKTLHPRGLARKGDKRGKGASYPLP